MTRSELRYLVYYLVDDTQGINTGSGGYFTSTQVNQFLNNAQKEVQKKLIQAGEMYYLKCVETSLVTNQQDYIWPSDFLKLHRLEVVRSGSTPQTESLQMLMPITLNQQDLVGVKSGTPEAYTMKKDRAALFPIPDSTMNNKTLRLYYSYRLEAMDDDTDTPDIPDDYQELVALYAARDCFIKDDRADTNLQSKIAFYEKMLAEMADERNQDMSRQIVSTTSEGYGSMW